MNYMNPHPIGSRAYAEEEALQAHNARYLASRGAMPPPPPLGDEQLATIKATERAQAVARVQELAATPPPYTLAGEVTCKPIQWLWPGRIAKGKLTDISGDPGLGKSQVALAIAATVSRGARWPVTREYCEPGAVIVLSGEDDPADTIVPRLKACGANLERVAILSSVVRFDDGGIRSFSLTNDLPRIEESIERLGGASLLVIDPVSAYLGGVDTHRASDYRAALTPLVELAARHKLAVLCVSHLRKGGGGSALHRVSGTIAHGALVRTAFLVIKDPEDESRRLFLMSKSNISRTEGQGLAFKVMSHILPPAFETSRAEWEAEPVTISADEACMKQDAQREEGGDSDSAVQDCAEWLRVFMNDENGSADSSIIQSAAQGAGFSKRTIYRAREKLGIQAEVSGARDTRRSFWRLASPPPSDQKSAENIVSQGIAKPEAWQTIERESQAKSTRETHSLPKTDSLPTYRGWQTIKNYGENLHRTDNKNEVIRGVL